MPKKFEIFSPEQPQPVRLGIYPNLQWDGYIPRSAMDVRIPYIDDILARTMPLPNLNIHEPVIPGKVVVDDTGENILLTTSDRSIVRSIPAEDAGEPDDPDLYPIDLYLNFAGKKRTILCPARLIRTKTETRSLVPYVAVKSRTGEMEYFEITNKGLTGELPTHPITIRSLRWAAEEKGEDKDLPNGRVIRAFPGEIKWRPDETGKGNGVITFLDAEKIPLWEIPVDELRNRSDLGMFIPVGKELSTFGVYGEIQARNPSEFSSDYTI